MGLLFARGLAVALVAAPAPLATAADPEARIAEPKAASRGRL